MPFSIAGPASPALPSLDGINRATDRISSGLRIDYQQNAAEAAITGRFDAAAGENTVSIRNAINQTSALQKADQTLGQGTETIERIQALTVQAGNGALNSADRLAIDEESKGLLDQFAEDLARANFNGNSLFTNNGSGSAGLRNEGIDIEALSARLDILRQSKDSINGDQLEELQAEVSLLRANIGAELNGIESRVEQLATTGLSIESSRSRLSDADLATEMVNLIQEQIQFEASVKVFDHQRLAEESILNLLS
tara:strand:- start:836 stop:1597 length:762 start_codon:yes stop_codon:yes gene_type:complete